MSSADIVSSHQHGRQISRRIRRLGALDPGSLPEAGDRQPVVHEGLRADVDRRNEVRDPFAAGQADTSSPVFAAAARSLGVSVQQLSTALAHAKQSLAGGN